MSEENMREFKLTELPKETKRFYLNGVKLKRPCSECGSTVSWDGEDRYLS